MEMRSLMQLKMITKLLDTNWFLGQPSMPRDLLMCAWVNQFQCTHFDLIYLFNGCSDEKNLNINVVEDIPMNNFDVQHFLNWSFLHRDFWSWTLTFAAHQLFDIRPCGPARHDQVAWAKMPCNNPTLINHNFLNSDPMEEFFTWFWSWEYVHSIWPCGILIWSFNFERASLKVVYSDWPNLPFLVYLIFYFC